MENIRIYRANKKGNGCAGSFSFSPKYKSVFLQMAHQNKEVNADGHATFGWTEGAANFKLGVWDIGEILAVLSGIKDGVGMFKDDKYTGLYHQSKKGMSILNLTRGKTGFGVSLYTKNKTGENRYSMMISHGEAEVLKAFFSSVIGNVYVFSKMDYSVSLDDD